MSFGNMMLAASPATRRSFVISEDTVDWNLIADGFGGVPPTKPAIINITIEAGVEMTSSSTTFAPLDLTGLMDGSVVNIINNGLILAAGGNGGSGADNDVFPEF